MAAGYFNGCIDNCPSAPVYQAPEPVSVADVVADSIGREPPILQEEDSLIAGDYESLSSAGDDLRSRVARLKAQNDSLNDELTSAVNLMAAKDEEIRNLRHAIEINRDKNGNETPTPVSAKSPGWGCTPKSKGSHKTERTEVTLPNGGGTPKTPNFDGAFGGPSEKDASNGLGHISLREDAEMPSEILRTESDPEERTLRRLASKLNFKNLEGSALGQSAPVQILIFAIALAGFVFVLVYASRNLDELRGDSDFESSGSSAGSGSSASSASSGSDSGDHGHEVLPIMMNISFSMACAGLVAYVINLMKQPLILGYLLGGVLVGPLVLKIVPSYEGIIDLSSIGLVFLLFMVGLELDVKELLKMGKVVLTTGALQFPTCVCAHYWIFTGLGSLGISYGTGEYATLYVAMTCGISSTMLVVKQLSDQGEADSNPGRLTIGILIFQDIWAIIVLAIQPKIADPEPVAILVIFAKITVLVAIAMMYAKYVMPAVLVASSRTVELMLVLALAWCFFIGCIAIGLLGLGPELAALIAGVALATFPYSNEFNGKIRYIRDFFLTLFFVGIGMQIPAPDIVSIATAILIAFVVLLVRWVGIYTPVVLLGGTHRLGGLATINLSEVSEFALVICSMGFKYDHVGEDTLTMITWCFAILAILSAYMLKYNQVVYGMLSRTFRCTTRRKAISHNTSDDSEHGHEHRGILLLGFHRIAAMLISEFEARDPQLLKQVHVIDFNEDIVPQLKKRGVKCSYGDFSSPDVLHHSHHGSVDVVISTIPDEMLHGITNKRLLTIAKQVWPEAHTIGIADNPEQEKELYDVGVNYVLRSALLVAERLYGLLSGYCQKSGQSSQLGNIFETYKDEDQEGASGGRGSARRRVSSYVVT